MIMPGYNKGMMQNMLANPGMLQTEKALASDLLGLTSKEDAKSEVFDEMSTATQDTNLADKEAQIIAELMKEYRGEV